MSAHYQSNLAGKDVPLHDGVPQVGFYKMRRGRNAPWLPVAIWEKDGALVCRVAKEMADPNDIWTYCCGNPVSKADAKHAFEHGTWPGDAPSVGHNSRQYGEDFDGIKAEFDDYAEIVEAFLTDVAKAGGIKTKAEADRANNMADAIGKVKGGLAKKADDRRDVEMRPHLEAQRAINAKFNPIIQLGIDLADKLRRLAGIWTKTEQDRLQKIADEVARVARQEAEAKARAEREAWEKSRADGGEKLPPTMPQQEIVAEKVRVQVGGQRGAKRSLKIKIIARVTDHAKALAHFADAQDVRDVVQKLAQRAVDAKLATPPGVEVVEEARL